MLLEDIRIEELIKKNGRERNVFSEAEGDVQEIFHDAADIEFRTEHFHRRFVLRDVCQADS